MSDAIHFVETCWNQRLSNSSKIWDGRLKKVMQCFDWGRWLAVKKYLTSDKLSLCRWAATHCASPMQSLEPLWSSAAVISRKNRWISMLHEVNVTMVLYHTICFYREIAVLTHYIYIIYNLYIFIIYIYIPVACLCVCSWMLSPPKPRFQACLFFLPSHQTLLSKVRYPMQNSAAICLEDQGFPFTSSWFCRR